MNLDTYFSLNKRDRRFHDKFYPFFTVYMSVDEALYNRLCDDVLVPLTCSFPDNSDKSVHFEGYITMSRDTAELFGLVPFYGLDGVPVYIFNNERCEK